MATVLHCNKKLNTPLNAWRQLKGLKTPVACTSSLQLGNISTTRLPKKIRYNIEFDFCFFFDFLNSFANVEHMKIMPLLDLSRLSRERHFCEQFCAQIFLVSHSISAISHDAKLMLDWAGVKIGPKYFDFTYLLCI